MLAVSALRSAVKDDHHHHHLGDPLETAATAFDICTGDDVGFPDFSDSNALLESIDFDDLFVGMDDDGDVLPDLEMDPELLAEFSVSAGEESSDVNASPSPEKPEDEHSNNNINNASNNCDNNPRKEEEDKSSGSDPDSGSGSREGEIASKRDRSGAKNHTPKDGHEKSKKSSSSQSKNSHGKRKVKVDWTPELHRRFVQAVEQLGVDKAVPSRILELMGIDCLTRHNIASHLQKYRSHRKHLLAREAEAASWTQRRQMYGAAAGAKRPDMNPWLAPPPTRPTMGFPPMAPPPPPPPMHHFRPLHVWGHPSMDQSVMHMWPKHLPHSPSPPPPQPTAWGPPPPPESPFWHHQRALTAGTPCFPQALPPPTRFAAPHPVPGILPHAMYKVDPGVGAASGTGQSGPPPRPLFDVQPSKESIDAAIGDVLSKPWLPLPLGLKPPSTDSVMVELQRQGVPKIPPRHYLCLTLTT